MSYKSLLALLTAATLVSALPTAEIVPRHPEVIPGPGMPSLASLNLTSAELYAMPVPDAALKSALLILPSPAFDARCGPSNAAYTAVDNIIACFNYFRSIGGNACGVGNGIGTISTFCTAGSGKITGTNIRGAAVSSSCYDVSTGALWVIDSCTRPDQSSAGFTAAYGNGDLVVGCTAKSW